jgi:hypothetical protein
MPNYLDASHREEILRLRNSFTARTEWPTWALLSGIWVAWWGLVQYHTTLGRPLTLVLLVVSVGLITWFTMICPRCRGTTCPVPIASVGKIGGGAAGIS